jgi:Cu/Ag efflux pump CusA
VPGTSSAYAERGIGGDVTPDCAVLARYDIMVQNLHDVIATALGGQAVTTILEGRQRFAVNMRYPRDNPMMWARIFLSGGGFITIDTGRRWNWCVIPASKTWRLLL